MKQKKNIVLIGFMGSGKTTLGLRLSYKLRMPVEDMDKTIEQREKRSITQIFQEEGEDYFRNLETSLLREISERKYVRIISTGGGTPVNPVNRELLKKCGFVVYLRVQPETVYERLKEDTSRPLLQCKNPLQKIKALLEERNAIYEECADIIIDADIMEADELIESLISQIWKKSSMIKQKESCLNTER